MYNVRIFNDEVSVEWFSQYYLVNASYAVAGRAPGMQALKVAGSRGRQLSGWAGRRGMQLFTSAERRCIRDF